MTRYRKYFALFLVIFACSCQASQKGSRAQIKINADQAELLGKKSQAIFSGNVVVRAGDIIIKTSKIQCSYAPSASKRITRIDIPDGLKFVRGDSLLIASKASYDVAGGKLKLMGEIKGMYNDLVLNTDNFTIDLAKSDK